MNPNDNKGNPNCCLKHLCAFMVISLFMFVPTVTLAQDFTVTTIGNHGDITVMEGAGNYDAEYPDGSPNPRSWYESPYQTTLAISGKSVLSEPPAPVLSYPTISGFPLNMRTDRTPIAGSAEPASTVQLFKNGLLVGEATALEKDFMQSFAVGSKADEPSLSPDGKTLAYMTYDSVIEEYFIWLQDLATGNATEIASKAGFPLWSPDGAMLAYVFYDENWNIKISIYDMDTGVSTPLTDDTDVNEYLPSWSSDGNKIAFVSTRSGFVDDIWIKDLSSGSMTRVTDGLGFANDLDLSPDAAKLAYVREGNLSVVDLLSGEKREIDSNTHEGTLDWSPESKRLAFVSFSSGPAEVFIHDTESGDTNPITDSGGDKLWPHWSPDGRQIVYGARRDVGDEVWLLPLDGQGVARMLRRVDSYSLRYLIWTGWGGIGYISDETLDVTYLAGHFAFDTVLLDAGKNTFYATATDDSGNTGPRSDEITIIFDASVILAGTITVTPPEVNLGDAVRADYTVSNSGNAAAMGLVVRTIVLDPEHQAVMASAEEVIDLNVGETHTGQSNFSTDNLSLKSYNVWLQAIHLDETENIASASFSVRDGTPPEVTIISPEGGQTYDGPFDLTVTAIDEASGVYKVEYQIDGGKWKDLPPSDSATGEYSTTLEPTEADEGPHTILFQATDNARNVSSPVSTSITIAPRVDMTTTLNPEQYGMNEDIYVHVHLANVGWEKAVALDVAIKDTGGETIASFDPIATTLGPNAAQDYDFAWNTGTTYAGAYHIYAVLTRAGDILNENTVDFTILPVMVIDSSVATDNDKTHYSLNEDVFVIMEVTNNGNAIASVLDVKLTISQAGGSALFSDDLTITDLTPGAQVGLSSTWNTGQDPAGDYLARMEVYHAGDLVSEGQTAFVIDPLVIITGTLEVMPTEVARGEAVGTNYAVRNNGNTTANGLIIKVLVRNQGTQAVVAEQEQVLSLGINETGTGTCTFSTGGYDLGPYGVILQYLWEGVTHDLAQGLFTVIDATPPQVTIISPEGGKTYDGPFELTVAAVDDASGVDTVDYQIDGGEWKPLPPSDPATGKYSTTWEPTVEDDGTHTIRFWATDKAGNTSTPVPVSIIIEVEFISPFERLTGSISAVPNPVSYGWEVSFIYSIKNDTTEAIEGLTVRVLIVDVDPNTVEIKKTLERIVTVPPNGTATGNLNASTLELGPGVYAAKLQVASGKAPEPRILESTDFEVVPSLEVTESMADPVNLLVWVNDRCHHKSHHQGIGEDEDDFDDYLNDVDGEYVDDGQGDDSDVEDDDNLEESEGKESIGLQCAPSKRCIRNDLLEAILAGAVDDYLIVYKGEDFEKELRNPYHTDILILGDHKPLTDHFAEELREKVYSGTGIISSLWLERSWGKYPYHYYRYYHRYAPIFGVRYKARISGRYHTITTVPSPITGEGTIAAEGKALRVEALEDTTIAGWIKRKKGWKHGYDPQYHPHPRRHPAIVLNEYGLGKAIYFAFDLGLTLTDDNEDQISELIENAISHVHRTPEAENFLPNQLIPYEVTVKALGAGFDVRITETFPAELDLYNPATGEWITESPWTFTMHLEPNEVGTARYYVLTPDAAGTYTIETEVGFVHEDDYIFFQKSSTEIVVETDSSALVVDIIAELDSLSALKWDRHKVKMAIKYMEKVGQREIVEAGDIDRNIHNILKAIDCLLQVKSTDMAEIKLMLDDLLRVEEGMYYYFMPVP